MISNDKLVDMATYIVDNKATIRQTAEAFHCSKTRLHQLLRNRLLYIDYELYREVRKVAKYNLSQRAKRGGMAKHVKYTYQNQPQQNIYYNL